MCVISLLKNEVGNEESWLVINLGCSDAACCCSHRRSAAAGENSPHRIPSHCLTFRYRGPHRGIPAGSARAWVRGGKKHCHWVAICGGKTRSPCRARGRASASQGRPDYHRWSASNPRCQGSNFYDSHCDDVRSRSCWERFRRQPCASGRQHYWIGNPCPGDKRKTTGDSEGD